MNMIRTRHQAFENLSLSSFRFLMEKCLLLKFKDNQLVYKENIKAVKNIYFILYGKFKLSSKARGEFG